MFADVDIDVDLKGEIPHCKLHTVYYGTLPYHLFLVNKSLFLYLNNVTRCKCARPYE